MMKALRSASMKATILPSASTSSKLTRYFPDEILVVADTTLGFTGLTAGQGVAVQIYEQWADLDHLPV